MPGGFFKKGDQSIPITPKKPTGVTRGKMSDQQRPGETRYKESSIAREKRQDRLEVLGNGMRFFEALKLGETEVRGEVVMNDEETGLTYVWIGGKAKTINTFDSQGNAVGSHSLGHDLDQVPRKKVTDFMIRIAEDDRNGNR